MLYRNVRRPAVEIAHLAGAHMGGANRKPRSQTVDPPEIDEFQERFLERHGRIEPGVVRTDRKIHSPMRQKVWPKERRNTADQDRPIRESVGKARRDASKIPSGMRFNPLPELPELRNSIVAAIARDQTGIDCADRSPDNPVRLDIRFIQSLIDARLVRSKRATTLKHQHYLAGQLTFRRTIPIKILVQAHFQSPAILGGTHMAAIGKAARVRPQAGPSYQRTDPLRRTRTGAICPARRWTKKKGSFLRLIL